jgi:Holliday junction resolvase-like predicted endonuclease
MGRDIIKSSRHQKIIGNFGENLVCNWLSRSGFEVTIVDHTGIDIIAYHPKTGRLGITVKSRTRNKGKEHESVNLFGKDDLKKLKRACKTFDCDPWIAIYVETSDRADLYLASLEHYKHQYRDKGKVIDDWKMTDAWKQKYHRDTEIKHIKMQFWRYNWFPVAK